MTDRDKPADAPEVALPSSPTPKLLRGPKALVTGASIYIDGGMTLYPGFATGG